MNFLWGWRTRSFCIFNSEERERDGRGCAFTAPFLAARRRERAVASTLAGEGKKKRRRTASATHREKCSLRRPPSTPSMSAKVVWKDPQHTRTRVFSTIKLVSEDCKLREWLIAKDRGIEVNTWQVRRSSRLVNEAVTVGNRWKNKQKPHFEQEPEQSWCGLPCWHLLNKSCTFMETDKGN